MIFTNIKRLFTEHPDSVGETYLEHMCVAGSFAGNLFLAALACAAHAVLPFAFEKTASRIVHTLYQRMVTHRDTRNGANSPEHGKTDPQTA